MTRLRRPVAAALAALAVMATLTACLAVPREDAWAPSPLPSATADAALDPALEPFYGQRVVWSSCGEDTECARVRVPLDWEHPSARAIDIALIRHRATGDQRLGSLLVNPGGPGASGVAFIRDGLSTATREVLQKTFDVVGFDPRGVGESTAVRCLDPVAMDAYLYDVPPGARGSDEQNADTDRQDRAFGAACDAHSDGILPFISTENAARDMDVLRAVLGDDRLNYLGYSYGTFLGATYAGLYPDRVGRVVLDGGLDPAASMLDVSVQQGIGFESSLRAFVADCMTARDCPFTGSVDDAMADLGVLLASVDRSPLPNADGRKLGADSLMTAIVAALYTPASWPALRRALSDALEGDPETAFQLADFYNGRVGGAYQDNSTEAFRAYNCLDYPAVTDPEEYASAAARLHAQAPTVADYWLGPDPCAVWPYPSTHARTSISADGAPPILVVGTTNDPATPYAWSVALADGLASGVLVTRVGEGHTGYNKGNTCVNDAVEGFLVGGVVPVDGLRCE